MTSKRFTEEDLLKDLDESSSHADALAQALPQELEPQRGKTSIRMAEPDRNQRIHSQKIHKRAR